MAPLCLLESSGALLILHGKNKTKKRNNQAIINNQLIIQTLCLLLNNSSTCQRVRVFLRPGHFVSLNVKVTLSPTWNHAVSLSVHGFTVLSVLVRSPASMSSVTIAAVTQQEGRLPAPPWAHVSIANQPFLMSPPAGWRKSLRMVMPELMEVSRGPSASAAHAAWLP